MMSYKPKVVIDTNVVFEGITRKGGASGLIIEAWLGNLFVPCVSHALAYEYLDVLTRKLSANRWENARLLFQEMLQAAEYVPIYYRWRPVSRDPADDHVIDCAMNANAAIVTMNLKDFRLAESQLRLTLFSSLDFVLYLTRNTP